MKTSVVDLHSKGKGRPEFDVYIGRRTMRTEFDLDSKWANPRLLLNFYEKLMRENIKNHPSFYNLDELKGKRLGCWCITTDKLEPCVCHGQILMKLIREKINEKEKNTL